MHDSNFVNYESVYLPPMKVILIQVGAWPFIALYTIKQFFTPDDDCQPVRNAESFKFFLKLLKKE